MKPLLYCCCGIDVHEAMIETCIIRGLEDEPEIIRMNFGTKPEDLKGFAAYLMENDCYSIAMESTGVYWRPVYEAIEDNCVYIENIVVTNASHMRNVPGRKTDEDDAEGTQLYSGMVFCHPALFQNAFSAICAKLHGYIKSSLAKKVDTRTGSQSFWKLTGLSSRLFLVTSWA